MKVIEWNIGDMMDAFGMSQQAIGNNVREGVFIKVRKGAYDSVKSTANFRELKMKKETKSAAEERARLDRLRADKIEIELKQTNKELVNIEQCQRFYVNLNHAIRQKLFTIPGRVAPLCAGKSPAEIQREIHLLINAVMRELRDPDFVKMVDDIQREQRVQKIKRKKNA